MKSPKPQKTSLNAQFDKVAIIIDPKEKEPLNAQKEYLKAIRDCLINCTALGHFRASIIHDRDTNEDNTPKLVHCHAFLQDKKKHTLKEWLTLICEATEVDKKQISIEGTNNDYLLVQYLRHDRKDQKAKYDVKEIATNDSEELNKRLNTEYVKPLDPVEEALKSCTTLTEFMSRTDYLTANRFRSLFKDLHSERTLQEAYNKVSADYEALVKFMTELFDTLALKREGDTCRLDNWRYWSDRADKFDLYS